ncbi:4'-phosphopantetheinyl transferase family protein [Massilia horti]|uniref:4'-phosphopantetheinyl transferase superfamily protein n=1 Tax=Massilia horti TaxID=2562153 RepID=A0A4Y9SQJ4_9BURK|nr:4'-phosphopantetheinyl transferase superfamily protein [Massilia horti]TFW28930.1 4'-phosphopantetheinyl transferase superfamily protein [Massilia horti]
MTVLAADCFPTELPGNEVHVWIADPDQCDLTQLEDRHYRLLSAHERDKFRSFHFDKDRRQYLAAHALTRLVLSRYTRLAPEEIDFASGPNGKPCARLPAPHTTIRHNLSHTAGLVGCVLARGRACGIDIESCRPLPALESIVPTVCSPDEIAQLEALGAHARLHHFLRLWTLKEAYAKATSEGLGAALAQVSFRIEDEAVACLIKGHAAANWWFHSTLPTERHVLALAVSGASGPLSVSLHRLHL